MSDSPTTSSTAEYEVGDFFPMERGRGRGRSGRGRRGSGSRGRRGRGSRGGRGQRGKRTQRGDRLEPDRVDLLRELREEKKRKANEMIDELDEAKSKKLLKMVAEKMPSILLDVAGELTQPGPTDPPEPQPSQSSDPSWCVCHHCQEMPTDREKVCCGMRPDLCSSIQPEMDLVILEPLAIQINQLYRNDIFARFARTEVDVQKSKRHAAYRMWILHEYGKLTYRDRKVIPSCVTWAVRSKYPDPNGQYTGFNFSW